MVNLGNLDAAEKIRKQLDSEHHSFFQVLMESTLNCLAYKTNADRPEGRKPSIRVQWEHFHEVIDLRESLNYRVGSLIWHCSQFHSHQIRHAKNISELKINGKVHHNEMRDANFVLSYLFDDVVFCAVSAFDYLAHLIFKMNHPKKRGKKYWNELVKVRNFEDPLLGEMIRLINNDFVKKLSGLRGRSIHTQADVGSLEVKESYNLEGVTHSFIFLMPEEAIRLLPIFNEEDKDTSIDSGANLIALHTIANIRDVLEKIGDFEYECLYKQ